MANKKKTVAHVQRFVATRQTYAVLRSSSTSWDIYRLTSRNDCKECGYHSCMGFADDVLTNRALINLCPYIKQSIYWLTPRTDCAQCSYPPCAEFVKKVAEGIVSPDHCPYTEENEKPQQEAPEAQSRKSGPLNEALGQSGTLSATAKAFAKEIEKANGLISDEKISADLDTIMAHMLDIFEVASASSSLQSQIRKFNNIYLPTVIKLLNRYIELDSRRIQSKSVTDAKTAIAVSVDDAKHAFAKLNDELLSQTSVDTEAEIDAFKSLLAIDGLSGKNEMVMPKVDEKNT